MTDAVLVNRDMDVATVTLNRPERMNALDKAMWMQLGAVLRELDADESLRCIVLRGAGGKALAASRKILLEGRIWGAHEACGKGLVNRVVPDSALAEEVPRFTGRRDV